MTRRWFACALGMIALVALTACVPTLSPAPPPSGPEAVIRQVFDPLGVGPKAVSIARCESGLNPHAVSPGGTYRGLFQLGPHLAGTVAFYGGDWFDPLTNAQVARDLYVTRGNWSAWPVCGR